MTLAHRSGRIRGAVVVAGVVALLALPAAALAGSGFTLKMSAPNHHPIGDCPNNLKPAQTPPKGCSSWPITLRVTKNGRKLSGKIVHYQFLFEGQVVSTQPAGDPRNHWGDFSGGVFHDTLQFPYESVGHRVTLQVVVKTKYGTEHVDWWVQAKAKH